MRSRAVHMDSVNFACQFLTLLGMADQEGLTQVAEPKWKTIAQTFYAALYLIYIPLLPVLYSHADNSVEICRVYAPLGMLRFPSLGRKKRGKPAYPYSPRMLGRSRGGLTIWTRGQSTNGLCEWGLLYPKLSWKLYSTTQRVSHMQGCQGLLSFAPGLSNAAGYADITKWYAYFQDKKHSPGGLCSLRCCNRHMSRPGFISPTYPHILKGNSVLHCS